MQMAALSRNTASVAQDFHNAGGGIKTLTINTSLTEDHIKQMIINHMKTASNELSFHDLSKTAIVINSNLDDLVEKSASTSVPTNQTMTMSKNVSPPALHPPKKRRKNSTHEKENENVYASSSTYSQLISALPITPSGHSKQGFDNYIRATHLTANRSTMKFPSGLEVLTMGSSASASHQIDTPIDATISQKRRKQAQPRKCIDLTNEEIDQSNTNQSFIKTEINDRNTKETSVTATITSNVSTLNSIRDKHLNRMVAKKKSCNICNKFNSCMVLPYHGIGSLLLHKLWRHSQQKYSCSQCGECFNKRYKCILHKKLRHRKNKNMY